MVHVLWFLVNYVHACIHLKLNKRVFVIILRFEFLASIQMCINLYIFKLSAIFGKKNSPLLVKVTCDHFFISKHTRKGIKVRNVNFTLINWYCQRQIAKKNTFARDSSTSLSTGKAIDVYLTCLQLTTAELVKRRNDKISIWSESKKFTLRSDNVKKV